MTRQCCTQLGDKVHCGFLGILHLSEVPVLLGAHVCSGPYDVRICWVLLCGLIFQGSVVSCYAGEEEVRIGFGM